MVCFVFHLATLHLRVALAMETTAVSVLAYVFHGITLFSSLMFFFLFLLLLFLFLKTYFFKKEVNYKSYNNQLK